jgi:hypothetical protein
MSTKLVTEILSEINKDSTAIVEYKDSMALRFIFEHAFVPEKKFLLPEGDPPYKPDANPLGMSPANLYQELKRLYVFCRADLPMIKREALFIGLIEAIHPDEAKLIIAVKDQELTKMYPNITHKLAFENGFTTAGPVEKVVKEKKAAKKAVAPKTGTKG